MTRQQPNQNTASLSRDPRTRVARLLIAATVLAWIPIVIHVYHGDLSSG
jgi:hypothetical protein